MSELVPVANTDKIDRVGDIIFVHGLNGDARTTWQKEGDAESFWPAWLGQDLLDIGIWSLSYDVSASSWVGYSMPLSFRATNALAVLDAHNIGDRPLVFITHSMGGLLAKQVIRQASDRNNPRWKAILSQTKGIIFLSTPHSGSDIASWLGYLRLFFRWNVSVDELKANNANLLDLNLWFRDHAEAIGVKMDVYHETRPVKGGLIVVDAASADPGIKDVHPISVDADHSSVSRLSSRQDWRYLRIKRFIRECFVDINGNTDSTEAASKFNKHNPPESDFIKRCFVHHPTLPLTWADRHIEMGNIITELGSSSNHVIVLTAIGGTGKTTISRKLVDELPRYDTSFDTIFWFSFNVDDNLGSFLDEAGRCLISDFDQLQLSNAFAKANALLEALNQKRSLLVLDGLEVMLENDPDNPRYGTCKELALRTLLQGICTDQEQSKVLITSRLPIIDLASQAGYKELSLPDFSSSAALNYMLLRGVHGDERQIIDVCTFYGNHALTLDILADYLSQPPINGAIEGVNILEQLPVDTPQAEKLQSILDSYWKTLTRSMRFFMTRLAAFRAGVTVDAFKVMAVDSEGHPCRVTHPDFLRALRRLRQSALIEIEMCNNKETYTSHPLIKDYFYNKLSQAEKVMAHTELKQYASELPLPNNPESLADLDPILEVFHHCIRANLYDEAYEAHERKRIDQLLFLWGHYSLALEMASALVEASRKGKWTADPEQLSSLLKDIGNILAKYAEPNQAMNYYQESTKVSQEVWGKFRGLQYASELLAEMGRFNEAVEMLREAEKVNPNIRTSRKSYLILGRLGYFNSFLGKLVEARTQLTDAIMLASNETTGDAAFHCLFLKVRADLSLHEGKLIDAYTDYQEALRIARRPDNNFKDYEGHILRGLGDLCRLRNRIDEATKFFSQVEVIAKNTGYILLDAELRVSLALMAQARGDLREAYDKASQVLSLIKDTGWLTQQIQAHIIMAHALLLLNRLETAKKHVEIAEELLSRSGNFWLKQQVLSLRELM